MENLFLTIVNMSITATWAVLAFTLLRPLLKKVPKWVNCFLWGIVALRLCLPFSLESVFSLIPTTETIPINITTSANPQIDTGVGVVNSVVNPVISESFTPDPSYSANPLQVIVSVASYIWIVGLVFMVIYCVVSYIMLKRKVFASVHYNNNIYYCDNIETPFILGVIKPKIYIPSGVNESDLQFILEHEKSHIKRKDYLIKPLSFLLLSVYWFNPAIWLWYILLCRDIESACDEKAIKFYDNEYKKLYSTALLNCSTQKRIIMACPVAFGETGVKQRIKSVLNYKQPAFWVVGFAIILTVWLTIFFVTNPVKDDENKDSEIKSQNYIYADEKTGSLHRIRDNFYYGVIDKTLEYQNLGLYFSEPDGDKRLICELGVSFNSSILADETVYFISDDKKIYTFELKENAKVEIFAEDIYIPTNFYLIEDIEAITDEYLYCSAECHGNFSTAPGFYLCYMKIDRETGEYDLIEATEVPTVDSLFESCLSDIKNATKTELENIYIQKLNLKFKENGSFDSGIITIQFHDDKENSFPRIANVLLMEDMSISFNEYKYFDEVTSVKTEGLAPIEKILKKIDTIEDSNFFKNNIEKGFKSFNLLYIGKSILANGYEREEPYTIYYDSLNFVAEDTSRVKHFLQSGYRFKEVQKPSELNSALNIVNGEEYFIVTAYYEKDYAPYIAFEDDTGFAGDFSVIYFNEMTEKEYYPVIQKDLEYVNNFNEKTGIPTTQVFKTDNISQITFYSYYGSGKGSVVPAENMSEIINWLGSFKIDKKAPDILPPGTGTNWVEIEYSNGTVVKKALDYVIVDGVQYKTKSDNAPDCYWDILSKTSYTTDSDTGGVSSNKGKLVTSNTPPVNTTSPEGYTTPYVDYFTPEGERVFEYYVYE